MHFSCSPLQPHKETKLPFHSTTHLTFFSRLPSIPSHKLSFRPSFSPWLPLPFLPKSSESEAAVAEAETEASPLQAEPAASEAETAKIVQAYPEHVPKQEEIFAVVMIGSRQYIVFAGRFIYTQGLKEDHVNDKIILNKVLLVGTRTTTYIGKPIVTKRAGSRSHKVIVFKYKKKKKYLRNIGHRQPNTHIRINSITGYEDYPGSTLDS